MSSVKLKKDVKAPPDPSLKGKGWAVIAAILVILVIFTIWMIALVFGDTNAPIVNQRCNPGVCAFNTITGIKRCPSNSNTQGLIIDLGLEFCTTRDFCQNNSFPCAVQADQTLNCEGVCDVIACRCVRDPS